MRSGAPTAPDHANDDTDTEQGVERNVSAGARQPCGKAPLAGLGGKRVHATSRIG